LGGLPPDYPLEIALVLQGQRPAALDAMLAGINDPHSSLYHHFLTSAQFNQRFGPTATERTQVSKAMGARGLHVEDGGAVGPLLMARGTAAAIEALFTVQLGWYRLPGGREYYGPEGAPRIPAALSNEVIGVLGLDSRSQIQTRPEIARRAEDGPAAGGLEPADMAQVYDFASLHARGLVGTNLTVALPEIDSFSTTDIADYDHTFGIDAPAVQVVSVGEGATGHNPEATLDIEIVQAVAPKTHIIAYEGGQDLSQLAQIFTRMVTDHRAQIISISLGACERDVTGADGRSFVSAIDTTFRQAALTGISVLAASGDSGAYGCQDTSSLSVGLPASDPYVTAVGGTTLYVDSGGGYGHEAGWEGPLEGAGSGGGLSLFFARPAWQIGTGVGSGMRQLPDVAADADPLTGYMIYVSGSWQVIGGTSAATPLWAGLVALADQAAAGERKPALGFLNPALYSLGSSAASPSPFHDVTIGGNLFYSAGPGWDYATGWGSPDAALLIPALVKV
jgi:kumamolisin